MLINSISNAGSNSKANEDTAFVINESTFVVCDGATGLSKNNISDQQSNAFWFIDKFSKLLKNKFVSFDKLELTLTNILCQIRNEFNLASKELPSHRYAFPSASFVLVHISRNDNIVQFGRLGDCKAYVKYRSGNVVDLFGKSKLDELDITALSVKENSILFRDTKQKNRELMNSPDGYGSLAIDDISIGNFYNFFESKVINLREISSIILTTDGFHSIIDTYAKYDISDLFSYSIEETIRDIRKIENIDHNCKSFSRFKKSDDATALKILFKN